MGVAVHVMPRHRLDHRLFGVRAAIVSIGGRRPFWRLLAGRANAGGEQQERYGEDVGRTHVYDYAPPTTWPPTDGPRYWMMMLP